MEETIKIIRKKLAEINEANESQDIKENYIETRDNVTDIALLLCKVERALGISYDESAVLPIQRVSGSLPNYQISTNTAINYTTGYKLGIFFEF